MSEAPANVRLLEGKRGLIVGIANDQSIAWGCARAFRGLGAELAITYLNDRTRRIVEPLAKDAGASIFMPLDVGVPGQMEAVFQRIREQWGSMDFLIHSIALSPADAAQGRIIDASRESFVAAMDLSCWSFLRLAQLAEPLMKNGGSIFAMNYYGDGRAGENCSVMGVAKAALESSVRCLASELCAKSIRVHAISPGPLATRAASGIPEFDELLEQANAGSPRRGLVGIDDVGIATAFLAHDATRVITGQTLYVDGGHHIVG